ncbi:4'-phosphopantetheinyl transferase superfamily protein [Paenibacillus crassostreae]|uniref:4'-phosphopantetheinyl transferase domain-containing protein n=1 Tax=Paenibacillus crassostreae TaxID=1763538 RepID=A0A167FAT7_9BACL|nr:4'-phosphopantetheinyl transferase superfamily protein [Paenibacillus crassostreae]AOZ90871.1 hypothetical protein LPB68_00720 [Paenibacillus crassostreae]OAB76362.1 hypothetical protein PNBC_02815 [Paenibacillus crassostreae]
MDIVKCSVINTNCDQLIYFQINTSGGRLLRFEKERLKDIAKQKLTSDLPFIAISYAYPHVIIWYSMYRIAVDIECNNKMKISYAPIFTNKEELTYFGKLFREHSELKLLTMIWTWKEAVGKYFGVGLKYGYQTIQIEDNHFHISPVILKGVCTLEYMWGINDEFAITMIRSENIKTYTLTQLQTALGLKTCRTMFYV